MARQAAAAIRDQVGPRRSRGGRVASSKDIWPSRRNRNIGRSQFLLIKHIQLPPVGKDERRRMILLEPDRFFPTKASLAVSVSEERSRVRSGSRLSREKRGRIRRVGAGRGSIEANPITFSRALSKFSRVSGSFALPAAVGERGFVKIERGVVVSARRAFDDHDIDSARRAPAVAGLPPEYLPAFGAALGADGRAE